MASNLGSPTPEADEAVASLEDWRRSLPSRRTKHGRAARVLARGNIEVSPSTPSTLFASQLVVFYEQAIRRRRRTDWTLVAGPSLTPGPDQHETIAEGAYTTSAILELRNWAGAIHTTLRVCPSGQQVDWQYDCCLSWWLPTALVILFLPMILVPILYGIFPDNGLTPNFASQLMDTWLVPGFAIAMLGGLAYIVGECAIGKLDGQCRSLDAALLSCVQEAVAAMEEQQGPIAETPGPRAEGAEDRQAPNASHVKKRW